MLTIQRILKSLNTHNVKYIVVGGAAAIAQGSVRLTFDLDICYSRDKENLENIVKAISPFNPHLRGAPKNIPFVFDAKTLKNGLNFTLSTDAGDIDLIGELAGLGYYNEVLKYSKKKQIYGMECCVLSLEGLVKNKKAIGREKDKEALIELEALLEIRRRMGKK